MQNQKRNEAGELMQLTHEEVPGYRRAFVIIFALGCAYLAAVFAFGGMLSGGH